MNLPSYVLRLIFNKFKDMFFFREDLWLNLPSDILRIIFYKLKEKRAMFAQVCRSWRATADDEIFQLLRSCESKSISLLLTDMEEEEAQVYIVQFGDYMSSLKLKDDNIEKGRVSFTSSQNQIQIIGSCRGGWIFLFNVKAKHFKLWNPLFDVKIRLPYFPSLVTKAATFFRGDFGIGVAVISDDGKLAFVKYGDSEWSYLCGLVATERRDYHDLISSKDSILALSKNGESMEFHAWNFEGTNILNVKLDFPQDMAHETEEPENYMHKLYIAESQGRVFLVVKWLVKLRYYIEIHFTANFYVYVLDEEKNGWNRVESLGDQTLFVGKNQTMLLPIKDDFEGCQKNSIYFSDQFWVRMCGINVLELEYCNDTGVFCLEDSSFQRSQDEFYNSLPSLWIV